MRIQKILATLLLVATVATMLVSCGNEPYDYMRNDLTSYFSESEIDFGNMSVTVTPLVIVTEEDTTAFIDSIIATDSKDEVLTDSVMTTGDVMSFRYRVTLDGKDVGLSNYLATNATSVTLGTTGDKFIADREEVFEKAILDAAAKPSDFKLVERAGGAVGDDKIVVVSFVATYKNEETGKTEIYDSESCIRIDLDETDGSYAYLYDAISSAECGKKVKKEIYIPEKSAIATYEITVHFVLTEEITLNVPVTLPEDYDKDGDFAYLGGKTVMFHLIPLSVTRKDPPELTSDYMKNILKTICGKTVEGTLTEETFREEIYETLQDYENYVYEEALSTAIDEQMIVLGFENIASYPKQAISAARRETEAYLKLAYDSYVEKNGTSRYPTFFDYEKALFGTNTEEGVNAKLDSYAENAVREYMIYYTAAKSYGISYTEEEIDKAYDAYVSSSVTEGMTAADVTAAYDSYYGKGYLRSLVTFTMIKSDVLAEIRKTVKVEHKVEETK